MSFGGSGVTPHQKLTPDYLAKQLPIFQQRVPRSQQPSLKFPTNSPPNLPLPPLLPGEEIQLQQHKIVCTGVFSEPAVGAVFITNYRIIFNGNSISDPESLDVIHDSQLHSKKDSFSVDGPRSSRSLMRIALGRGHNEPTFNSYLTNPEPKEHGARTQPKWIQTGLKKLGSLRRSPKRSLDSGSATSVGYLARGGEENDHHPLDAKSKHRPIYLQDTVSLDSVSVSSQSEFSECPTTDMEERTLPSPLFENSGEHPLVSGNFFDPLEPCLSAERRTSASLPIPDSQVSSIPNGSCITVDSGINMADSTGNSLVSGNGNSDKPTDSATGPLLPMAMILTTENGEELDFEKSMESETLDHDLELRRQQAKRDELYTRHGSLLVLESDSDSTEDLLDSPVPERTALSPTSYSKIAVLESNNPPNTTEPQTPPDKHQLTTETEDLPLIDLSESQQPAQDAPLVDLSDSATSREKPSPPETVSEPTHNSLTTPCTMEPAQQHPEAEEGGAGSTYTNLSIPPYKSKQPPKSPEATRLRSSSTYSPGVKKKKPKPLPRATLKRGRVTREDDFTMSVPVDFRPVPAPRKNSQPLLDFGGSSARILPADPSVPSSLPADSCLPSSLPADSCLPSSLPADSSLPPADSCLPSSLPADSCLPSSLPADSCLPSSLPADSSLPPADSCLPSSLPADPSLPSSLPADSFPPPADSSLPPADSSPPPADSSPPPADSSPPPADSSPPPSADQVTSNSQEDSTEPESPIRSCSPCPPIPPPRRRKKWKTLPHSYHKSGRDSDSASATKLAPTFEDISGRLHDLSGDVTGKSHDSTSDVTGKSHDSTSDVMGNSHDSTSDVTGNSHDHTVGTTHNDPEVFTNNSLSVDVVPELFKRRSSPEPLSRQDSCGDASNISMVVNRSCSSSTSSQRPFSEHLTLLDVPESERDSGQFTMVRSGAVTWSPRSASRKVKSPLPSLTRYTLTISLPLAAVHSVKKIQSVSLKDVGVKLPEGILVLCRNLHSMKLHVHPNNTYDADGLKEVMDRHFLAKQPIQQTFAFHYYAAIRHPNPTFLSSRGLPNFFHLSDELERLGLDNSKLWRVTKLLQERSDICPTYPKHLIVPICTPDLDLIRGARLYHESRFPSLCWVDRDSGAALLRAAVTNTERGQAGSHLEVDEALLHAICATNHSSTGDAKLYIFTEKSDSSKGFTVPAADPKHTTLTADQVKTYYYHNCKFKYSINPPTFKSVRHSFNKLQAMLENKLPDEDYLIALDTTHWLSRVSELLTTATSACHKLTEEAAHVLVCYEAGWDRTTQIVSLAQLLLDPYYRTMDGFQVLIQKEWVWFGHPFCSRQTRRGRVKEDGPIFLQWIDCVWQVMHQCPSAFEFNQRFLMVLVEHSYSSLFGTFMMDCEKERKQSFTEKGYEHMSVSSHTVSFWTWVSMINAAGRSFYNHLYDPSIHPGLIYPLCAIPCLKLWTSHYCKYKAQENINQTSTLQRQLEELVKLCTKLNVESNHSMEARPPILTKSMSSSPPPSVFGDESQEWKRHEHHSSMPAVARKTSLSKTTSNRSNKSVRQYESLEHYLKEENIEPAICKHISLHHNVCQGYLYKQGGFRKNWLNRWFVLDIDCQYLAYFLDQESYMNKERPKGVIHLNEIQQVYQSTKLRDHMVKHIFTVDTPGRIYLFQAPTILTMELWMACLRLSLSSVTIGPMQQPL